MTQTFNILNADGKMVDQIMVSCTNQSAENAFRVYLQMQRKVAVLIGAVKAVEA